ncbi:hypothetical protein B0O99DRAFT_686312 [Bisporella sp. PMI_857]|nr:hypothetical protein B0O99DRAFT_686312 [Bisporella sp. PMI_857]
MSSHVRDNPNLPKCAPYYECDEQLSSYHGSPVLSSPPICQNPDLFPLPSSHSWPPTDDSHHAASGRGQNQILTAAEHGSFDALMTTQVYSMDTNVGFLAHYPLQARHLLSAQQYSSSDIQTLSSPSTSYPLDAKTNQNMNSHDRYYNEHALASYLNTRMPTMICRQELLPYNHDDQFDLLNQSPFSRPASFGEPTNLRSFGPVASSTQTEYPFDFYQQSSPTRSQFTADCCTLTAGDTNARLVHNWAIHFRKEDWTESRCLWEKCTSTRNFRTAASWINHVKAVHQKSFWCMVDNCEKRQDGAKPKAFGTATDLNRHFDSLHGQPVYCDKKYCHGRKNSDLKRTDKREVHEKKWHGALQCTFGNCRRRQINGVHYGFSTQKDLVKHQRERHNISSSSEFMHEYHA